MVEITELINHLKQHHRFHNIISNISIQNKKKKNMINNCAKYKKELLQKTESRKIKISLSKRNMY